MTERLVSIHAQLHALIRFLDPTVVGDCIAEHRRGALPSSSVPGGSRAAERPEPKIDRNDRDVTDHETNFRQGLTEALRGLQRAERSQRWLAAPMGQWDVYSLSPKVSAAAMASAVMKATQEIDKTEKGDQFGCDVCGFVYKLTKNQRPKAARPAAVMDERKHDPDPKACNGCYQYGRANPDGPIPPDIVIARRVERELREEGRKAG